MKPDFRGTKKRVHGRVGTIRNYLYCIPVVAYTLISIMISYAAATLVLVFSLKVMELNYAIFAGLFSFLATIFLYNWLGAAWLIRNDGYYARPMTGSEYEQFRGKNLIHYTDHLLEKDLGEFKSSGQINLYANGSVEANYSMMPIDRQGKYVWFHLSRSNGAEEPEFESYWFSHRFESTPRSYKVIVPLSSLPRVRLLYRPMDGAVMLRDDYEGPAQVETNFPWYGEKIYVWKSMQLKYRHSFAIFYAAFLQHIGRRKDKEQAKLRGNIYSKHNGGIP